MSLLGDGDVESGKGVVNSCVGGSISPRATKNLNSPLVGLFSFGPLGIHLLKKYRILIIRES